jgi:transposase-like protein
MTAVACPHCGGEDTERVALFGTTLLLEQFWCRTCRSPFERVRGRVREDAGSREAQRGSQP